MRTLVGLLIGFACVNVCACVRACVRAYSREKRAGRHCILMQMGNEHKYIEFSLLFNSLSLFR